MNLELFDANRLLKKDGIKSERASIIHDILIMVNSTNGIKRKLTARNCAVFLSPFPTKDLYVLLSMMKQSKNPAGLFWSYAKPK